MLSENLKNARKARGYTQETLAAKLNVVRQTVSKWEKGLSVPDADMLQKISETLEIGVVELLGGAGLEAAMEAEKDTNQLAEQLARINEQLAVRNRRSRKIWKTVAIVFASVCVFWLLLVVASFVLFGVDHGRTVVSTETVTVEDME